MSKKRASKAASPPPNARKPKARKAAARTRAQASKDDHRHALGVLLALTAGLSDEKPVEDALRSVTDAALELLPANHASIRLLDASGSELLSGARSGAGSTRRPMSFRRGRGVIGWVVDFKQAARIDDVSEDARFVAQPSQGFEVASLVAEPLWSAGEVIGVLSASSPERGAFSVEHQRLLQLLANCSTPPIERGRLRRLALTDDLTRAYNQRYLSPRYNEEIERAKRTGQPLSVLMLDLDHFKRINDVHGHDAGDVALRLFADRVRALVRRVDIFIRRGGEEFLLVMPATTNAHARITAERIRRHLADSPLDLGDGLNVRQTVSIGVATWDEREAPEALLRRADVAMYDAKSQGRDRVCVSAPPTPNPHTPRST